MAAKKGRIRLWELGSGIRLGPVRDFLEETFGPAYDCPAPRPLLPDGKAAPMARKLMPLRIPDPGRLGIGGRYSPKDLRTVARILAGSADPSERRGVLFSGTGLEAALGEMLGPSMFDEGAVNIVFTAALPCTWDPNDCRYHPRTVLCGFPSVVSTTGAVEGPGKPRGLYVARMMGLTEDEARRKYIGRYLEHDDVRMPEVAKGLAAQAVFYGLTGEPFCEREDCRLFNAKWQEQLVRSQFDSRRFCSSHARFLKDLKRPNSKK